MTKTLRYLLSSAWAILGGLAGFSVIVTAGCYLTGVPLGEEGIFLTYFAGTFMYAPLFLYLYSYALATTYLNIALSMGARRRDYFLALQGCFVFCVAAGWLITVLVSSVPVLGRWTNDSILITCSALGDPVRFWCYPFACLGLMVLGCLTGQLFSCSRLWGTVMIIVCILGLAGGLVWLMVDSFTAAAAGAAGVNAAIAASALILTGIGDFILWRIMRNYTVR